MRSSVEYNMVGSQEQGKRITLIEKSIEEIINEELPSNDKEVALEFVAFLRKNEFQFVRDRGYWRGK